MNRVSYHQNVFDLLEVELPVSAEAMRMIEECESRCGRRLPAALREWDSFEGAVSLGDGDPDTEQDSLWYLFSNRDRPVTVRGVVDAFRGEAESIPVLGEHSGNCGWSVKLDGSDDPPVGCDNQHLNGIWTLLGPFSTFLFSWLAEYHYRYLGTDNYSGIWPGQATSPTQWLKGLWSEWPRRHANGIWSRCPREPALLPPHIDQLIDALEQEPPIQREDGPTTYGFHTEDAHLRVTTDHWTVPDGHSAWWLSAESTEALGSLIRRVWHIGSFAESLRR